MRGVHKDIMVLVNKARSLGWKITQTRNGHLKWTGPNGEGPLFTGSKAEPGKQMQNLLQTLRNGGLDLRNLTASPSTAVGMALEDALRRKEKVKITPQDLGVDRPECQPSEVIIRHPNTKGTNMPPSGNLSSGKTRVATIVEYMQERPGKYISVIELANEFGIDKQTVASTLSRLLEREPEHFVRVGRGLYKFTNAGPQPGGVPQVVPTPPAVEVEKTAKVETTKNDDVMIIEVIKRRDGYLIVEDENGALYRLTKIGD